MNGDGDGQYDAVAGRRFSFALIWSFLQAFSAQGVSVVVTFILARQLGPEIFGLATLAIVYVLLVDMLLRQGMSTAVIQRPSLTDLDLDTAFWILVAVSAAIVATTVGVSGWWAELNSEPRLRELTVVLSVVVPLRTIGVVQDAILRRSLDFKAVAFRSLTAALVGATVAITMTLKGFGVWALIWQPIATTATEAVWLWTTSKWRPSFRFSGTSARSLLSFAVPSSVATLGVFISERSDTVVTSVYFGSAAVGLHRFSVRFVDVLVGLSSGPFLQVSLPELARHQKDKSAVAERITGMMHVSSLVSFPVFAGLAAAAPDFVALAGEDWLFAVRPLQILCVAGAFKSLNFYNAPVLQALGRTHLLAMTEWTQAVLKTTAVIAIAVRLRSSGIGTQVVGLAVVITILEGFFLFGIAIPMLARTASVRSADVLRQVIVPTLGFLAAISVAEGLRLFELTTWMPTLIAMPVTGALGLGIAVITELLFVDRLRREVRTMRGRMHV